MVSGVLNLANAFLELVNTPFGQVTTRIALLTTALVGFQGIFMPFVKAMTGKALLNILQSLNPTVIAVTAGIAALGLAIYGVKKYVDEVNKPLSDFNEEIDSINDQLQNNQTRLDEINAMPWNARTSEILEEKAALEKQNEELEKNLELLNQEKYERAQTEAENFIFNTGEQKTITRGGTTSRRMSTTFDVTVGGEKAYEEAARQLEEYRQQLEQTGQITDDQRKRFDEVNAAVAEQIEWLQVLIDRGDTLTESQQRMYDAYYAFGNTYDVTVNGAQALINAYTELTNAGVITEETYQRLVAIYPQLADGAVQTANGYQIQQSALENLMSAEQLQTAQIQNVVNGLISEAQQAGYTGQALYNLVAAQINASNTGLNFSQQMSALQALALQAGYTMQAINAVFNAGGKVAQYQLDRWDEQTIKGLMSGANGKKMTRAEAEAEVIRRKWGSLTSNYQPSTSTISVPSASAPSTKPSGASGKTSSTYDDSKRSEAQAEIKKLQSQQDAIQDQIDAVNEKYDAQLEELEDINDALEEQIQLQKLLQALTEAKASKKMVFKDGRFQYLSDVDAISKAQSNLEEFYQEQELKKKKKRIEEERQAELAGLNAEKKNLQDRISAWRDYISEMSGQYSSSLSGLQGYVDSWNSKIGQIKQTPDYTGGGGNNDKPKDDKPATEDLTKYKPSSPTDVWVKRVQAYLGWNTDGYWDDSDATKLKNKGWTWQTAYNKAKAAYDHGKKKFEDRDTTYITSIRGYKRSGYSEDIAYILAAKNIDKYAKGALSAQSGLSMVGEQGPELRVLNQGDGIIPAKQTATLWSFANDPAKFLQNLNNIGGKTEVINVANVSLPNVQNPQEFISGLRNLAYQRTYKPNFGTV